MSALYNPIPDIGFSSVRIGKFILQKGILSPPSQLSFLSVNSNWFFTSWLFDISSFVLYRIGRETVLRITAGILLTTLTFVLSKTAPATSKKNILYLALIVTLIIMNNAVEFKPLLITAFFFGIQIYMLQKNTSNKICFFLLYLMWANCDLGFITGLVYLIFYLSSSKNFSLQEKIRISLCGIWGAIFSYNTYRILSNPYSIILFFEPSPDFHLNSNRLQALGVLAGLASASLCKNGKESSSRSLANALISVFAISLVSGRYLPLALVASYPLILIGYDEIQAITKANEKSYSFALTLLVICFIVLYIPREGNKADKELMQFLDSHRFFGEIVSPLEIAGKSALVTNKKASMESVFGLYNAQSASTYRLIYSPWREEWDKIIADLNIGGIIVKRKEKSYYTITERKGWALIFQNEKFALFVKEEGINITLISKWGKITADAYPRPSEEERLKAAQVWLEKGNPYRARWEILELLKENPNNQKLYEKFKEIENQIQNAKQLKR